MTTPPRTDEELQRFLARELDPHQRLAIEEEASHDPELRRRLAASYRERTAAAERLPVPADLLRRAVELGTAEAARAPGALLAARWRRAAAGAAAAALLLTALGLGWWLTGAGARRDSLLDDTPRAGPASVALALLAPTPGAQLDARGVALEWQAIPDAVDYVVTVLDGEGDIVANATVAGPPWRLEPPAVTGPHHPGAAPPPTPRTVYWYVTARLADGSSLASEVRALVIE